jgi:phage gp16-like protein
MNPDPTRKNDLARIHMAKAALGLDDDTYRAALRAAAGVESSSQLDFAGRQRVIAHFIKCGWDGSKRKSSSSPAKPAANRPKRPTPAPAVAAMCRKVRAQLISLGRLPDTYADGIAKQMFGVQFYEWCQPEQLHAVVAALTVEQQRKGVQFQPKGRRV